MCLCVGMKVVYRETANEVQMYFLPPKVLRRNKVVLLIIKACFGGQKFEKLNENCSEIGKLEIIRVKS